MTINTVNILETARIAQHKFLELHCNYSHEEAGKMASLYTELLLQELQIQALIKQELSKQTDRLADRL